MLGFYAGVLGIIEAGVVGAIAVLATQKELRHLILWVLIFGGVVLIALIGVVVAMNIKSPMKLQLGQVTGRELIEYERMTLGDSASGEYVKEVPVSRLPPGGLPGLEPGEAVDEQEGRGDE